ncbi:MAG: hypothetical protein ABI221_00975 [Candidatus Saccharimonadales bacterium]
MKTIALCCSANFYRQAVAVREQLVKLGFAVIIPEAAEQMRQSGDFDVSHYKTWFGDKNDYYKKTALIKGHFVEIDKADIVLVLNYQKHGVDNYIGGNTLMEMAIAFYRNKPIYILNEMPQESAFLEEIIGLNSIALHGHLETIPT